MTSWHPIHKPEAADPLHPANTDPDEPWADVNRYPTVEDTVDGWTRVLTDEPWPVDDEANDGLLDPDITAKIGAFTTRLEEQVQVRHPDSQRFVDQKQAEIELHDRKQADYGTNDDPFANIRRCERYGIPAWVGCAIRMADKMARIERAVGQWSKGETVTMSNESLLDSFDDLSVYATIGRILYEDAAEES